MNTKLTKIISGLFMATAAVQTAYAGNITDIDVFSRPNQQKVVKVRFDKDVTLPTGFVTSAPARIALDFAQTNIALNQKVLTYGDSLLNKISVAQNDERARLIFNLNKPGQYNAEIRGNEVWIIINESADTTSASSSATAPVAAPAKSSFGITETVISSAPAAAPAAPEPSAAVQSAPTNIDFRKGSKNSGVVELTAPGFTGQPDIEQQRDRIVITLKNHTLPTALQRSLDVTEFKTPVKNITLKRIANNTQLIIRTNHNNWELVSKSPYAERFTFQILPKDQSLESSGLNNAPKTFKGRKISLDFQDIEVRTILQILAKESGTNIVASDTVNGKMTLSLKDVPWDQALDLVMQARNLDMRHQGNIINIAPRDELLAKDKAFLQAEKEIAELGSLYSQNFQLKYKNVEEFRKILRLDEIDSTSSRNTLLSNRGSALIDPATNTLIVTDTRSVIEKFRKLIDELDVPAQQVMIEARIVEAVDGFSRDLGIKFGASGVSGQYGWGNNWANAQANYNSNTAFNRGETAYRTWDLNPNVNLPVASSPNSIALVRALSSGALGLELTASEQQDKSKTLSNPRVLTQNRKEAKIESGTEIPYQDTTGTGSDATTTTTFKKAVLGLTVTPNITPDGQIIMNVQINKDTPVDCTVKSQTTKCIQTKNLNTQAMVENGGTLIVGGIYEEENSNGITKVPLLGDIPVLGNLFKARQNKESRRELLIFITPRIMDNVGNNLRY